MERFFRSLKKEWIPETGYRSFEEAKSQIVDYLLGYYGIGPINIAMGCRRNWLNNVT